MYISICADNHFKREKIPLHISKITTYTKTNEGLERGRKLWRNTFHIFLKTQLTTFTLNNSAGYHSTLRPDPKSYLVFQKVFKYFGGSGRTLTDLRRIFAFTTLCALGGIFFRSLVYNVNWCLGTFWKGKKTSVLGDAVYVTCVIIYFSSIWVLKLSSKWSHHICNSFFLGMERSIVQKSENRIDSLLPKQKQYSLLKISKPL